ncbi:hypothetical protein BH789_gp105 [Gordonia phage GMA6]|uniref:Uncharacterized protein n=1 Tax=Gordonia phage GMA6 TaxID=1647285 RepID=A0A0K0NKX1_9CAUD|nr:hypothetical protein BH789_gp105 [Gordonia phage GMA6]AKL88386.1 hypothetical protein GMA6_105 [Gordonia phage GMA6]
MTNPNVTDEKTVEQRRSEILEELSLPQDSKASDVIQCVINSTGHHCTLFDLMVLAQIFDGNIQLYVTDNEKTSVGNPRPL